MTVLRSSKAVFSTSTLSMIAFRSLGLVLSILLQLIVCRTVQCSILVMAIMFVERFLPLKSERSHHVQYFPAVQLLRREYVREYVRGSL